jgi:soluble lytic murein transglycosylase-like protein
MPSDDSEVRVVAMRNNRIQGRLPGLVFAVMLVALVGAYPAPARPVIAPLFTPEVQHWSAEIARWSAEYGLDANLLATVMQIESCGHPTIASSAGAQGLFQVMPFHFTAGEVMTDPDTNARRAAWVLDTCLGLAGGEAGAAMACYNGGPSVLRKPSTAWPKETQRYLVWGLGIYMDATSDRGQSAILDGWLAAGGQTLCQWASTAQAGGQAVSSS